MAIIALRAWYLEEYEPIQDILQRPHDLRLSRNSLLKSGLRADFLEDRQVVADSIWFSRYLAGEVVTFYIEGSGGYTISNIDLISQEIYLTKQEINAFLEPVIFWSYQRESPQSSEIIQKVLEDAIAQLNPQSRYPLTLQLAPRPQDAPLRLSRQQLRQIRKSLLFVADGSAVTQLDNQLIPSPIVCVELGYALQSKDSRQILLLRQEPESGVMSFDVTQFQQLSFKTASDLSQTLPPLLETLLQRLQILTRK